MIAHDGAPLEYGTWVCACERCMALCAAAPETLMLIIKRSHGRDIVAAPFLAAHGADAWVTHPDDYVREVFVAQQDRIPQAVAALGAKRDEWLAATS